MNKIIKNINEKMKIKSFLSAINQTENIIKQVLPESNFASNLLILARNYISIKNI